jgi:hypothetical protein
MSNNSTGAVNQTILISGEFFFKFYSKKKYTIVFTKIKTISLQQSHPNNLCLQIVCISLD